MKLTIVMSMMSIVLASLTAFADSDDERLRALRNVCSFIPSDDLSEEDIEPTPDDIIRKYHVTTNDVLQDLKVIVSQNDAAVTNFYAQVRRSSAITWIGQYGTTNDLSYLATIMTNSADYAQDAAVGASMAILQHSPKLIDFARGIVTNRDIYSMDIRRSVHCGLLAMCTEGESDGYIDDPAQHARIAAFFLEWAAVDNEEPLGADKSACRLNPSYRHSQQRRNNLAALRPPNLTGKPAELYDAAQADAAQGD